jgi:hypothetical protein
MRDGGTGNFGGFRSGCTSNLVAADGVLNAPEYTRTCSCSYQNQTSLALVHTPDVEIWTTYFDDPTSEVGVTELKSEADEAFKPNMLDNDELRIREVGINFGAPGDRMADDGTLWLEYPRTGGPSPDIPVVIHPDRLLFRMGSKFQSELDRKSISEELRKEFENSGFALHKGATVSVLRKGAEWRITKNNKKTVLVKREESKANPRERDSERLNVYEQNFERYCHHSSRIKGEGLKWVVASGLKGVSSVAIDLSGRRTGEAAAQPEDSKGIEDHVQERPYTVRLYFAEPDNIGPGQRVFDVAIQGRNLLEGFDIVREAGEPNRELVREFKGVLVKDCLTVALSPSQPAASGAPLISGVEVRAEGW